jgi:TM2 domain-containing membrane protein YozV
MHLYIKDNLVLFLSILLMLIGKGNAINAAIVNSDNPIHQVCPIEPVKKAVSKKEKKPYFDYGDRTKLSAFILCALLGFSGAHHFYLKHYFSASLQLSLFIISTVLSILGTALFFSWLFLLALWAWVAADLLLIIFGGLRLRKGKKLIPFEQSI